MKIRSCIAALVASLLLPTAYAQQHKSAVPKGPWSDTSLSPDQRADLIIKEMTIDEKLQLLHGLGGFDNAGPRSNGGAGVVSGIPRFGLPDLQLADSAVGVREAAKMGRYSTLLPSSIGAAATWDPSLAFEYGALIGRELRDEKYNVTLGGGVDITREPRNGRNFEYAGEDPILAGTTVAHLIQGMNSQQVISDVKHYAFNDQETGRDIGNVLLDKRDMRETDLLAFEIAVTEGKPGMVMCSYNKVNGDWSCENDYLLNDVLKKEWGFKGFVLSDWGGTHSTVKAALAGLDNEEPDYKYFGDALKQAVLSGQVPMSRLDDMVHRIIRTEIASGIVDNPPTGRVVDPFFGAEVSQRIAENGIVLLRNEHDQLPLTPASLTTIAIIGEKADTSMLSGGGSAQVDPPGGKSSRFLGPPVWFPTSPMRAIQKKAPGAKLQFNDGSNPAMAAELAKNSKLAIVFLHQPMTEARDAKTLTLPDNQDDLVNAVAGANPNTIVVLENGGPCAMPWVDKVTGIVETWYPGVKGADALANILFGDVNPSGKLPVTFAKSDADLPTTQIPGMDLMQSGHWRLPPFDIPYGQTEGLKVGYKWFDAENKDPLFPFGYGLSYTTFKYSDLKAEMQRVSFTVSNTGERAGAEIAEVYAALPASANEPPKRLVGWEKVKLAPGESQTVMVNLEPKYLSIFNVDQNGWQLLPGQYTIYVGGSSRSLPLSAQVTN